MIKGLLINVAVHFWSLPVNCQACAWTDSPTLSDRGTCAQVLANLAPSNSVTPTKVVLGRCETLRASIAAGAHIGTEHKALGANRVCAQSGSRSACAEHTRINIFRSFGTGEGRWRLCKAMAQMTRLLGKRQVACVCSALSLVIPPATLSLRTLQCP